MLLGKRGYAIRSETACAAMVVMGDADSSKEDSRAWFTLNKMAAIHNKLNVKGPTSDCQSNTLRQALQQLWAKSDTQESLEENRKELERLVVSEHSLKSIQKKLHETKLLLADTVKMVLERGEKIDDMTEKSGKLQEQAEGFRKAVCKYFQQLK